MLLTAPLPFDEALDSAEVRAVLPTTGRTRELQQLEPAIKRRALFSATVDLVRPLQALGTGVDAILRGEIDQATVRLGLKEIWKTTGFIPDADLAGGLQDVTSTDRINLQLETNVQVAQGFGHFAQGQDAAILDEWPAQELFRATNPAGKSRDWAERWARAGGTFFDGRMIARKDDPVWEKLGDPDLFDDGIGNPYPPFAFNSGMDVRDIARDEAVSLGVIGPDEEVAAQSVDLNAELQASPDVRDESLRAALEATGLGTFDADGVFHFAGGGA